MRPPSCARRTSSWRRHCIDRRRRLAATFSGARGAISTLRFSPDGRRLLAASDDGVARIYDCDACAQPEALLKLAEARAAIGLTEDERTRIVGAVVG